jgi:tripartite-type tricarboxylate transporter receptor subunit TctC
VAFPVGGLLDTVSRIVGDKLTVVLGQQFIIESRPGAGGTLATAAVARAEPDGYT